MIIWKSSWYKQICKAFGSELKSWFSLQAVPSRNDNIDLSEPLPMEFSANKWLKASSCCSTACNVQNKGIYWIDSSFWVIGLSPIFIFLRLMKHLCLWINSSIDFFPLNLSNAFANGLIHSPLSFLSHNQYESLHDYA